MRAPLGAADREAFVRTARRLAGKDATSPFSVDDVHHVARALGLNGVLFLEKAEETRHANVVLGLDRARLGLYDPWLGVKVRPHDDTQLGMYCRPVGAVGDEFRACERLAGVEGCADVWARYARRGALLRHFLRRHRELVRLVCVDVARGLDSFDLPPTQDELRPADCAPLSLYVIARLGRSARDGARVRPPLAAATAVATRW